MCGIFRFSHLCNHVTKSHCIVTVPPGDIAHCALLPRPESPRHCWSSLGPWRTRTRRRGAGTRGHGGNSQPIRGRRGLGWTNGRPGQGSGDPGWSWRHLAPNQRQTVLAMVVDGLRGGEGGSREQRDHQQFTYQSNQFWREFGDLDLEI